jgi:hypothetical protein
MKATRIHYFYAQEWPTKIWFGSFLLLSVGLVILVCNPSTESLADWKIFLWFAAAVVLSLPLGYCAALLLGFFILGPLYYDRSQKNGGPFKIGDRVQILSGSHRGRVVRVRALWQGDRVRVDLGEKEKETFEDVFASTQLLREGGLGQGAAESKNPPVT